VVPPGGHVAPVVPGDGGAALLGHAVDVVVEVGRGRILVGLRAVSGRIVPEGLGEGASARAGLVRGLVY